MIDYDDATRVIVTAITPELAQPGAPVTVSLEVQAAAPVELDVALWPPRVGGRELVLGSGVTRDDAARPDDARAAHVGLDAAHGALDVEIPLSRPWHPRTAMITVERVAGGARVPAIAGPRTRDGLGSAGLVAVANAPSAVTAAHAATPPVIDGVLDEPAWAQAEAYTLVDSLDGEPGAAASQVRLLWDAEALYVGAQLDDDDVWSQYERQDDPLWKEEAFELFLFGAATRRGYLELQVSPRGVTFDARFEHYRKGDEAWDGAWRAAATVDGTVARRDDRDRAWTVELAVPFAEICEHTAMVCPPQPGATTRINAFRLDRPRRGAAVAVALSPTRVPDFHAPENAAVLELGP